MRTVIIATMIVALSGVAYAADDSLDKTAKKIGDGFGNMLTAVGQEIKKTGIDDVGKKSAKDEAKPKKNTAAKADPNPKGDRSY